MPTSAPGAGPAAEPAPGVSGGGAVGRPGHLWLVRHGQTEWSASGRHTGATDVPLTPAGQEQARALAVVLSRLRPALVLTSPRQRAVRTAELAGLPEPVVDGDLVEWDYGDYEGLTTPEIRRSRPGWTVWSGDPPGGETAGQVAGRVDRVLARIRAALPRGDVVVVAHGHVGRVLTARWLGLGPDGGRLFTLEPASPCVLGTEHGSPVVQRWNLPNPAAGDGGLRLP